MAWFDYKAPCNNCPFRRSQAGRFNLGAERVQSIAAGTAFECHKTTGVCGPKHEPQQCAGLLALLHDAEQPNAIMQIASRLYGQTFDHIDRTDTFTEIEDAIAAHSN